MIPAAIDGDLAGKRGRAPCRRPSQRPICRPACSCHSPFELITPTRSGEPSNFCSWKGSSRTPVASNTAFATAALMPALPGGALAQIAAHTSADVRVRMGMPLGDAGNCARDLASVQYRTGGVLVDERLPHRVECAIGGRQPLDRRDRLAHRGRLASGSSARAGRHRCCPRQAPPSGTSASAPVADTIGRAAAPSAESISTLRRVRRPSCSGPVDRSVIIILPKVEKRLPARPQFPWK